jgi:hypothetical protein
MKRSATVLAILLGLSAAPNLAQAGFQGYVGESCLPDGYANQYFRESGSLRNAASFYQGYICPLRHIDSSFTSSTYYRSGLAVFLQHELPSGTIYCTPLTTSVYGPPMIVWGVQKTGTGTNYLSWSASQIGTLSTVYQQTALHCTVPPNGRIDGYMTSMP